MNKVSVIVPIYNAEKYLHQCLDSIVNQSYTNLEILLVDDGSTDQSNAICQEYCAADPRVRLLCQPNQGQATARNAALDVATGDFVSFIDADDFISLDYIETIVKGIGTADVCAFSYTQTSEDASHFIARPLPRGRRATFVLSSSCSKLFRRQFLQKNALRFSQGKSTVEDIEFSFRWWTTDFRISTINYCGYFYRSNPHSTTSRLSHANYDTNEAFRYVLALAQSKPLPLRDGRYLSYYLFKLNLFLLRKKKNNLSSHQYFAEWQKNDLTIQEILAQTHWKPAYWLRGEKLLANLLVSSVAAAKAIGLARPLLWIVQKL